MFFQPVEAKKEEKGEEEKKKGEDVVMMKVEQDDWEEVDEIDALDALQLQYVLLFCACWVFVMRVMIVDDCEL